MVKDELVVSRFLPRPEFSAFRYYSDFVRVLNIYSLFCGDGFSYLMECTQHSRCARRLTFCSVPAALTLSCRTWWRGWDSLAKTPSP